jgi:FkbM family methyltransferase
MSEHFRSQFKEDAWLAKNWPKLGLPDRGFFVEFGAGDGVHFSNTYWLEHDKGWTGLLIEPDPRNVVNRPGIPVERACVGPVGTASFCLHPTDGYLSGELRTEGERIEIPRLPLSDILRKHEVERVDLISIDTEGTELAAWRTLDLNRWRPTIAIIELYTWQLPDTSRETIAAMRADGYEMVGRTEGNGIFKCTARS